MIKIGNKRVGTEHKPFILAEISGNHNQSLDRALEIVAAAAKAGAEGIKLQTYTADTMTLDMQSTDFRITDNKSLWSGESLHNLYNKAFTPWEWHKKIFDHANRLGMVALSTPFDETAVDFLEELEVPCFKVASFEVVDIPLLKKIGKTRKPVIISSGMATASELDEAVRTLRNNGTREIVMLKCTSTYPATPKDTNITTIPHMRELFECEVGLSDHTMGVGVAVAAIAFGAVFIEKHLTLNRADGGVDSAYSMEPDEMKLLAVETERAWQSLGSIMYGPVINEKKSLQFRRSIYVAEDLKKGEVFNRKNLRVVRPGFGLEPKYYEVVLGKRVTRKVNKGTRLTWNLVG